MRPELSIEVAAQVRIPKARLTSVTKKFLREKLFIMNSEYIIKERLGKPVYDVPKFFDLVEQDGPGFAGPGFMSGATTVALFTESFAV